MSRAKFWVDLTFAFPFDGVINLAMGGPAVVGEQTALYIGLIRFLKLVRSHFPDCPEKLTIIGMNACLMA